MNEARQAMDAALKRVVVPHLRNEGFKGTLPHFRRLHEKQIDLLTFQFNKYGGSFVVEIAKCPPDGVTTSWGKHIPPAKVNAHSVNTRLRLGSTPDLDHWFHFAPPSHEIQPHFNEEHFLAVANSVITFHESQAKWWWNAC
jgi:hypothetical protein